MVWYNGTIIDENEHSYKISYTGYSESKNEWVLKQEVSGYKDNDSFVIQHGLVPPNQF